MLWVPPGFAHGFLVLSECADFLYKCTDFYAPRGRARDRLERSRARASPGRCRRAPSPLLSAPGRRGAAACATRSASREGADHGRRRAGGARAAARVARGDAACARSRTRSSTSPTRTRSRRAVGGSCARTSIINAAAYTAVDRAEAEPELAQRRERARAPAISRAPRASARRAPAAHLDRLRVRRHGARPYGPQDRHATR